MEENIKIKGNIKENGITETGKKRYEYKREYIASRKLELIHMLGGKCEICGIKGNERNIAIFDFHHKNPDEKEFNLGQNTIGNIAFEKVKVEARKCKLLCSNCHRMLRFGGVEENG